jgi:hypothetical protein
MGAERGQGAVREAVAKTFNPGVRAEGPRWGPLGWGLGVYGRRARAVDCKGQGRMRGHLNTHAAGALPSPTQAEDFCRGHQGTLPTLPPSRPTYPLLAVLTRV